MSNSPKRSLDLRLAAYGAIATAAAATQAHAGVIYTAGPQTTPINGDVFLRFTPTPGQIGTALDPNAQFVLPHRVFTTTTTTTTTQPPNVFTLSRSVRLEGLPSGGVAVDSFYANLLGFNQLVGNALFFSSGGVLAYTYYGAFGPWLGQRGFAGLNFVFNGNTHFGWADISVDAQTLQATVHCIAFEDTADTEISTPSSFTYSCSNATNDVPEPSSLGLMAMGVAGLMAYRRRKKAA